MFPGIGDHLNDPELEDEEEMEIDEAFSKAEHPEDLENKALNEDVLSVSPLNYTFEMLSPSNNPYRDPIFQREIDLDFGPNFTKGEKVDLRKSQGKNSCAVLASDITSEEIMWMIEYYNLVGRWLRPRIQMRMHYFPETRLHTPRMELTNKLVELGFGSTMHPFLFEIIKYYDVAPI